METQIGQQLRKARQERKLSLEQVSLGTHIRVHYIQAMEAGDFDSIPSLVQARGFLRAYAGFLGLDPAPMLKAMNGDAQQNIRPSTAAPVRPTVPTETPTTSEEATSLFAEIGEQLRQRRELLGISLDDVERHTHLRQHYLRALEAGDLDNLPSPVQGRGMLSNYASFLGMDPEPLLLRFAEALQARLAVRHEAARKPQKPVVHPVTLPKLRLPPAVRRVVSSDMLVGGIFVLFLTVFVVWGAIRIFSLRAEQPVEPTAPSIAEVLLATSTPSPTITPPPATPTAPPIPIAAEIEETPGAEETAEFTPPPDSDSAVQVYITVRQRAWMRAVVDGRIEFEGRVLPGSAYSFAGEDQVEILTGNGAALQVFFQQQDRGLMGDFGEVVQRVYTRDGALQPTPTITPTPTATPRQTATPRPSATARPGQATVPALP